MRLFVLLVLFLIAARSDAQTLRGDMVRLNPTSLAAVCSPGDLRVSSSDYSLQVCGLLNLWSGSLLANPMTANGDLITRAGGVPSRLGIGTTNYVLRSSGSAPAWALLSNASIDASAAIDATKIADGSVSSAEFQYAGDLTGLAQAQIDLKAPIASPTFTGTVSGITATMVGLGNVDNTSDANKPVSTATQTALNLKANLASPTFTGVVGIADGTVSLPSLIFSADTNTGIYRAGADDWHLVAGGYSGLEIKKSTGSFANLGMGGSASASDQVPLSMERSNASAGTYAAISNTSTSANAYGGVRVIGDNGNVVGAFNAYTDASTIDAFDARVAIRTDGSAKGIVLLTAATAPNDIKFYQGGGATTDLSFVFNDDNSMQFMQQLATPATPASNTMKVYQKSDDKLYMLNDAGTESAFNPMTTAGDLIYGGASGATARLGIGTTNQVLTVVAGAPAWAAPSNAPGAYRYIGSYPGSGSNYWSRTSTSYGDFTVTGTIPTIAAAASGNSGITVANAASDLPGVSFTAPRTGTIRVTFDAVILPGQNAAQTQWAIQLYETTIGAVIGADIGGSLATNNTKNEEYPVRITAYLNVTASTAYNIKLQGKITAGTIFIGPAGSAGSGLIVNLEYVE
jgi:hypothetical protein